MLEEIVNCRLPLRLESLNSRSASVLNDVFEVRQYPGLRFWHSVCCVFQLGRCSLLSGRAVLDWGDSRGRRSGSQPRPTVCLGRIARADKEGDWKWLRILSSGAGNLFVEEVLPGARARVRRCLYSLARRVEHCVSTANLKLPTALTRSNQDLTGVGTVVTHILVNGNSCCGRETV